VTTQKEATVLTILGGFGLLGLALTGTVKAHDPRIDDILQKVQGIDSKLDSVEADLLHRRLENIERLVREVGEAANAEAYDTRSEIRRVAGDIRDRQLETQNGVMLVWKIVKPADPEPTVESKGKDGK